MSVNFRHTLPLVATIVAAALGLHATAEQATAPSTLHATSPAKLIVKNAIVIWRREPHG